MRSINNNKNKLNNKIIFIFFFKNPNAYRLPHFSTGILAATGPIFQSYLLKNKYLSQKSESLNAENVLFAYR